MDLLIFNHDTTSYWERRTFSDEHDAWKHKRVRRRLVFRGGDIYPKVKRVIDVVLCFLALPLLVPLASICALAVTLDSPGSALFVQERAGKKGKRFKIYKFRTMSADLDDTHHRAFMKAFVQGEIGSANGDAEASTDDAQHAFETAFIKASPRKNGDGKPVYKPFQLSEVTRVGRILRKTSLDELPQVYNVLKGEMSLVGPRPNVLCEVEAYQDWHRERLDVLPGITGLAQVNGRSCIDFDTIVQYDIEYARSQCLGLDLRIMWRTILAIITGNGAS